MITILGVKYHRPRKKGGMVPVVTWLYTAGGVVISRVNIRPCASKLSAVDGRVDNI